MAAAILLFCFQGAGRKLSTECRPVAGSRTSWHPIAGRAPKRSGDLVQRGQKNKALRRSVHQVRAGRAPKRSGDLVQRERKNKALRGSVHQVRAGRAPKSPRDLVQRGRKNKVLLGFVHQPRAEKQEKAARAPAELALHYRQSLVPPLRGANILPWSAAGHRPSWRPIAGKALCLRYGAPTFYPEARPAAGKVRARLPAKPINSVFVREPRC